MSPKQTYEIRLRQVPQATYQALEKIAAGMREKTLTAALEKLILQYPQDQESIKQLQQRNTDLHKAIQRYLDREELAGNIVRGMAIRLENMSKTALQERKLLLNHYDKLSKIGRKETGTK